MESRCAELPFVEHAAGCLTDIRGTTWYDEKMEGRGCRSPELLAESGMSHREMLSVPYAGLD
jgi:hypothetical protein